MVKKLKRQRAVHAKKDSLRGMLLVFTKHSEKALWWRSSHYNTISSLHCFSPSNGTFGSQYLVSEGEELVYDYGERSREIIEDHEWLKN